MMDDGEWREVVSDLCYQFGYPTTIDGGAGLSTGGLSALECAFEALGWSDPHPTPELTCQWPGCDKPSVAGTPWDDPRAPINEYSGRGYIRCCSEHYRMAQPPAP